MPIAHYLRTLLIVLGLTGGMAGCSTIAGIASNPAANNNKARPDAPKADAGGMRSFADMTRDATRRDGFLPVWEKDDRVWLEIAPGMLDQPFFFTVNRTHGTGERGIYASQMEDAYIASFHRIGDRIQLLAHNKRFYASEGSPQNIAVHQGFSDSLLAASTVQSQPHSDSRAFLIDANALLLSDIPSGAQLLENAYRLPYAFDPKQSSFVRSRADSDITALQVQAHYIVAKLPVPNANAASAPKNLLDPRSLFLGFHYSFARLPEPMRPRKADDRLGHFVTTRWNFGEDSNPIAREYLVNRWRLEKADPDAALSEPKQAIVYWLDQNIPLAYRPAITEGVLAWNKAFEKIGFKNAIVVKQQEKSDDFDTMEARRASIRWFVGSDVGLAIGPSRVDPRTGEILDADIGLSDPFARSARRFYREDRPDAPLAWFDRQGRPLCHYQHAAAEDMLFGLDLLEARGDIEPGSPGETQYVNDVLRDVTMHEVGHTLGLRHNFRASTIYNEAHLADKQLTARFGIAGSVMDYTPVNLALKGQPQGEYKMRGIGEYDYWAIEYAYRPLAAEEESQALAQIAARSTEPHLAFATDEDAGEYGEDGFDPDSSRSDLGNDPLAFFAKRAQLMRELWARLQAKSLPVGTSYATLRRTMESSFSQLRRGIDIATKYVGGLHHVRDHAGTGRPPLTPIAAATQRRALQLLINNVFAPSSFTFSPDFLRKLTPDYLDRFEAAQRIDIELNDRVLALQQQVLGKLYRDVVANRILDYRRKVSPGTATFNLSELYDGLQQAIWQEAAQGGDPDVARRTLQREHLKQLIKTITRANAPADAVALSRDNARALIATLQQAQSRSKLSRETRVHYADAVATLQEALKASFSRSLG